MCSIIPFLISIPEGSAGTFVVTEPATFMQTILHTYRLHRLMIYNITTTTTPPKIKSTATVIASASTTTAASTTSATAFTTATTTIWQCWEGQASCITQAT